MSIAKENKNRCPHKSFVRGEALPEYSYVHKYPSGEIEIARLSKNAKIQGVYCHERGQIRFYKNGQLEHASLAENQTINGLKCGSKGISFFESGQIKQVSLAEPQMINGVNCSVWIAFYESNQVKRTILAKNQTFNGVEYLANTMIMFYLNGCVQKGTLVANQMIDDIEFLGNTKLAFYANGRVQEGTLASDQVIDGSPRKKNQKVRVRMEKKDVISIKQRNFLYHTHLASKWNAKGDYDKAIKHTSEAIALYDNNPTLWQNRGIAWQKKGNSAMAMADFNHALEITSNRSPIYTCIGTFYYQQGNMDLALKYYNLALGCNPTNVTCLVNRSQVWAARKEYDRIAVDLERALKLAPGQTMVAANLAWLLSTCTDASYRNGERALRLIQKVVQKRRNGPNLDTLAAAYAELGNFKEAMRVQKTAIDLIKGKGQDELLRQFEQRLEFYKNEKPWRE